MGFDETVASMTLDQARWVRAMRIDQERMWRWIADERSSQLSPDDQQRDFSAGQYLCSRAAALLGEDAGSDQYAIAQSPS